MTNRNTAATSIAGSPSSYVELNRGDWIPVNYDQVIYDPAGYDAFIWNLQKPVVVGLICSMAAGGRPLKYLDFACGTGRIIAEIEQLVTEAVGLDTSEDMLSFARKKLRHAALKCGNLLEDPGVVSGEYDVITAFRFFLNTEAETRIAVMSSLARRVTHPEGRLIFNVHGNRWSSLLLMSIYQRMRGWGPATTMSYDQARRLVESADLEIDSWYGFGLWPRRLYRSRLAPLIRSVDRWALRQRALRWVSHDMLFVCRPKAR